MRTRPIVVAVRLNEDEALAMDAARGSIPRSAWLRWVLLKHIRSGAAPK